MNIDDIIFKVTGDEVSFVVGADNIELLFTKKQIEELLFVMNGYKSPIVPIYSAYGKTMPQCLAERSERNKE